LIGQTKKVGEIVVMLWHQSKHYQQTQLFFISLGQYQHYNNGSPIPNQPTQFPWTLYIV